MSTIGSLMLALGQGGPSSYGDILAQTASTRGQELGNETSLLKLADLKRQQESEALLMERIKNNPELARQLFGGSTIAGLPTTGSPPGGMPAAAPGPITQSPMGGGPAQQIPASLDLSQFATQGGPPQSVLGSLGPAGQPQGQMQAPRNPVMEMAAQNPRAAMMLQGQMQAQQDRQFKLQEQKLKMGSAMMGSLGQMAQGVTDQAGWDQLRQDAAQIDPQLAARLPQVYSKEVRDRVVAQALDVKDSLELQVKDLTAQAALIKARKEGRVGEIDAQLIAIGATPGQETKEQMQQALANIKEGKVEVSEKQGVAGARERSLGETAQKRLESYDKTGMAGQDMHTVLDETERLMREGVYGNSLTDQATMAAYKRGLFQDDKKAQRTARLQELGSQLVLAHGSLGNGVSAKDAEIYAKAAGNFQQAKNLDEMKQSMQSMRTIGDTAIRNANAARESYEKTGKLPAFQERGAQAQDQPASQGSTKPVSQMNAEETRAEIAAIKARGGK